jgi:MFS superfamily sulfate permease-like transporter
MIWGSGIFTGLLWLIMGLSGAIDILARITKKPVVIGIMLGLGFSFIYDGIKMIAAEPIIGIIGVVITFLFLTNTRFPAMLLLLLFGIAVSFIRNPELFSELMKTGMHLRLPEFGILNIDREGMIKGILMLGIPQIPLTLGNAIIAITAENNRLFPKRKVKERTIAIDHGFMNIFSTTIGGVPLCHGAGGMAGHVRFGAKTGGALVILGVMLVIIGLFFSDSVAVLFNIFPAGILGVILCFAGLELASVAKGIGWEKEDAYVMLATAGISLWNIGVGFLAGLILYYAIKYRIVKV